ncbi:hypothetical protein [Methylobacterium segetis]|uniref:hypothetical protein n=1 Tax=Methylobacterium segetis TaxID=2488750 RepID=UPI0010476430|nr:hypothetical protein [Methylobacterium segetis]
MAHRFRLGQFVRLRSQAAARNANRLYEIVRLLPEEAGEPGYAIRSTEADDREVREREIAAASRASLPSA